MPDVLIRNFPAEDLALLDQHAARLGVSRTEYLRRQLHKEARRAVIAVTSGDLSKFSTVAADLVDDAVMSDAWS